MTGKPQVARLGSKIQQSEELAKSETRQLKETTDKSMKEVTRTLATLVEQHRSKVDCFQSSRSQPSAIETGFEKKRATKMSALPKNVCLTYARNF